MEQLKAAIIGAGRMAGTIDDEVVHYPACQRPYSHAAGYAAVPEVDLVAFADIDQAKVRSLQQRYGVPRGYADYREMIDKEKPDIVSITTPCTSHAEMTIFAAEHGAKGIYAEKAFACSPAEADAIVEAVERNNVKYNMGTRRRWHAGANKARELIDRGDIGAVNTVISYGVGGMLHTASHYFDLLMYLAGDRTIEWIQGAVLNEDFDPSASRWETDLSGEGVIQFEGGCRGRAFNTSLTGEFEVIGSEGAIRTTNNGLRWYLRRAEPIDGYARNEFNIRQFPHYTDESPTVRLIRDLVQAIRTDSPTQQGVRRAAVTAEIAFGIVESHRRGGAKVSLPVKNREFWMFSH